MEENINGFRTPLSSTRQQSQLGKENIRKYKEEENAVKLTLARVVKVNYKYNTVDVVTARDSNVYTRNPKDNGKFSARLPVDFGGKTPEGKVYGTNTLVTVGSLVLIGFLDGMKDAPIVLNIYGELDNQSQLTQTTYTSADETDEEIQQELWSIFSLYPSMTYESIDGNGNKEVTFSGKTFMYITDGDTGDDFVTDSDFGYEQLPSSFQQDGEQIEPKSPKAPTVLYVHQGVYSDHRLTFFIKEDGTLRVGSRHLDGTGVTFQEMKSDGTFAIVQKKGTQSLEGTDDAEKFSKMGIDEYGNVSLKSRKNLLEVNDHGVYINGASIGALADPDLSHLEQGIIDAQTSIGIVDGKIELKASQVSVNEISKMVEEQEASLTVAYDEINSKVSRKEFDALTVGTQNLLANTNFATLPTAFGEVVEITQTEFENNVNSIAVQRSGVTQEFGVYVGEGRAITLKSQQNFMLSFEGKFEGVESINYIHITTKQGVNYKLDDILIVDGIDLDEGYKKFHVGFNLEDTIEEAYILIGVDDPTGELNTFHLRKVQLEKGDKVTDWGMHYTDFAIANAYETEIKQLADEIALTAQASERGLNELGEKVGDHTTRIEEAELNIQPDAIVSTVRRSQAYTDDLEAAKQYAKDLADAIDIEIEAVSGGVGSLSKYIDGAFKDGVIDETEAQAIAIHIETLESSKSGLDTRYDEVLEAITDLGEATDHADKVAQKTILTDSKGIFDTAHDELILAIETAIEDGKATEEEKLEVDTKFGTYRFNLKRLTKDLEKSITFIAKAKAEEAEHNSKAYTDGVVSTVNTRIEQLADSITATATREEMYQSINEAKNEAGEYADGLIATVNKEIGDVATSVTNLDEYMEGAFKDGVIDETEAIAIEKYIRLLNTEKSEVDAQYLEISKSTYLSSELKATLLSAQTEYHTRHLTLIETINALVDSKTVSDIDSRDLDTKFLYYNDALSNLAKQLQKAIDNIADGKVDASELRSKDLIDGVERTIVSRVEQAEVKIEPDNIMASVSSSTQYQTDLGSMRDYAEGKATEAGTDAKSHADTKAGEAETNAKDYADSTAEAAETNAKGYTDEVAGDTEQSAKDYADARVAGIQIGGRNLLRNSRELFHELGTNSQSLGTAGVPEGVYTISFDYEVADKGGNPSGFLLYAGGHSITTTPLKEAGKTRVEHTFTIEAKHAEEVISIYFGVSAVESRANEGTFYELQLEAGHKATSWSLAFEDMESATQIAQERADEAIKAIEDIADDSKLTPSEKKTAKREWETIKAEKASLLSQGGKYDVPTSGFTTAYSTLDSYITPLLAEMDTTSDIVGNTFRGTFGNYYTERTNLLKAITDESRVLTGRAEANAQDAIMQAGNAQEEADRATADAKEANDMLGYIASDSKLTPSEKKTVKKEWEIIKAEQTSLTAQAGKFGVSTSDLAGKYGSLDTYIAPMLASMGTTNTINGTTFRTKFTDYYTAKTNLLKVITDEAKTLNATAQSKADTAQARAETAEGEADIANGKIADIANDSKLTPSEKKTVKREWEGIVDERLSVVNQGTKYAISTADYTGKYTDLKNYIEPLLTNMSSTQTIVGATFRKKFTDYYTAKTNLLKAVTDSAKDLTKTAQDVADQAVLDAEEAQSKADSAEGSAVEANGKLADISSDSKLTAGEKKTVKKEWEAIVEEQADLKAQAIKYSVSTVKIKQDYDALSAYITPLLSSMGTTSNITGAVFRRMFNTYYKERTKLLKSITDEAKDLTYTAQQQANKAVEDAQQAQTDAETAITDALTANSALADIADDNKLSKGEKKLVKKEWETIQGERSGTVGQGTAYGVSTTNYTAMYNALSTYITPLLSNMKVTSTIVGATFRAKFKDYYTAKSTLLQEVAKESKRLTGIADGKAVEADKNAGIADGKAVAAKTAADTAKGIADTAKADASTANISIADIADDNKITPSEKKTIRKEWEIIFDEKEDMIAQGTKFSVPTAVYTTKYSTLSSLILPILRNMGTTSNTNGDTFRLRFKEYYEARTNLLNAVASKSKDLADKAQREIDGLSIGDVNLVLESLKSYVKPSYLINMYDLSQDWVKGEEWTVVVKGHVNKGQKFAIWANGSSAQQATLEDLGDGYHRAVFTVTSSVPASPAKKMTLYNHPSATAVLANVEWVKLVRAKRTSLSWTPSPQDIEDRIYDITERVKNAEIAVGDDRIISTVTESRTYIDAMGEKVTIDEVLSSINQIGDTIELKASQITFSGEVFGGNATFNGNISGVTGTFGKVTAHDEDGFLLEKDGLEHKVAPEPNLLKDHGFELLEGLSGTGSATNSWQDAGTTARSRWTLHGSPKVTYTPTASPKNEQAIFGQKGAVIRSAHFVSQYIQLGGNQTYTISSHFKRQWNATPGLPRFEVDLIDGETGGRTRLVNEIFSAPPTNYDIVRYATTFNVPTVKPGDYIQLKISGGNSNWIQTDGAQLVKGDKATSYSPDEIVFEIINGDYSPIPSRHLQLWGGAVYPKGSDTIRPSKPLNETANGWILVWQGWSSSGTVINGDYEFSYITKRFEGSTMPGNIWRTALSTGNTGQTGSKYLEIYTDRIEGHALNGYTQNDGKVLSKVLEW